MHARMLSFGFIHVFYYACHCFVQFFAFYQITNEGSSWIGPLVTALLAEYAQVRYTFVFILFSLFVPAVLLHVYLDVPKGVLEGEAYATRHKTGAEDSEGSNIPMGRIDTVANPLHKNIARRRPRGGVGSDSVVLLGGNDYDDDSDDDITL